MSKTKKQSSADNMVRDWAALMSKGGPLLSELKPYVERASDGKWPMLRSPLLYAVPYFEQLNALYNAQHEAKQSAANKAWVREDYEQYVALHEKPYRALALLRVLRQSRIAPRRYFELLGDVWMQIENVHQTSDRTWEELFTGPKGATLAAQRAMMSKRERELLDAMPKRFVVYRGTREQFSESGGWSWSLSRKVATWFARRFKNPDAVVLFAHVNRSDALAYLTGRSEQEVIVRPSDADVFFRVPL